MARWTGEQVARLAPDPASLAAARKLAVPQPWSETGATETLVWGKCQGSGRTPYQVSIDLTGPAFRCSCPSRKFPCKHGLALLLLWVQGGGTIADSATAADFAQEWAAGRAARTTAREAAATTQKPVDPEARARRIAERTALMDAGVADLQTWLADVLRGGVAGVRQRPYAWWDGVAARLVDAQLPGLAQQLRDLGSEVTIRDDWPDHLLRSLGRLWAATRAWQGREALDEAQLGDLRVFLGWPQASAEIRQGEAVTDRWQVLGAWRTDNGRVEQQRTWLWGERSGRCVQVLDFAAGGQVLPVAQVTGSVLEASVAAYPGSTHHRVQFVDEPAPAGRRQVLPAGVDVTGALDQAAATWAANPWAGQVPVQLTQVRVEADGRLVDRSGLALPLVTEATPWWLLAVTGGHPVDVFGELAGQRVRPLSVLVDGEFRACA